MITSMESRARVRTMLKIRLIVDAEAVAMSAKMTTMAVTW